MQYARPAPPTFASVPAGLRRTRADEFAQPKALSSWPERVAAAPTPTRVVPTRSATEASIKARSLPSPVPTVLLVDSESADEVKANPAAEDFATAVWRYCGIERVPSTMIDSPLAGNPLPDPSTDNRARRSATCPCRRA